jgi:carboxypeptidase Taq
VAEIARVTAAAQGVWADARKRSRFADFAPTLSTIVALKQEHARCLAEGGDLYQALLEDFEPGARVGDIAAVFARLRPRLSALLGRVGDKKPTAPAVDWNEDAQFSLANDIAVALGYDFSAGRLDRSVHPFTSGQGRDVRITTRVQKPTPFDCLYSTIHEVGHALYEQGISPTLSWMPAAESASMGVHESQSRLWENQIGRSRAFANWLHPRLKKAFANCPYQSAEELFTALNRVEASYIRTEADEVTYNLHIILRFELERALIAGDLPVADLEEAWNQRFQQSFGIKVPEAKVGVLQDIHWAAGLFGYFPTYSLGNIYAGELYAALGKALPDLEQRIAAGDFAPILSWLRKNIHEHGRLYAPTELIARAVGHEPSEEALLSYLEAKHRED